MLLTAAALQLPAAGSSAVNTRSSWHTRPPSPRRRVLLEKHMHTCPPHAQYAQVNAPATRDETQPRNLQQVQKVRMQWHLDLGIWFRPITSYNEMDTYFCSVDIPSLVSV